MKSIRFLMLILVLLLINGCAVKSPTFILNEKIDGYKYVFISPTSNLTSSAADVYGRRSEVKSVNPGDVISGILLKNGYTKIPELNPALSDETIIVNYGESGKRNSGLVTTIEVTIQFISAKTHSPICSCSAEGKGETEADKIRDAITRCLSGLLSN
jgi:hypothetical protein